MVAAAKGIGARRRSRQAWLGRCMALAMLCIASIPATALGRPGLQTVIQDDGFLLHGSPDTVARTMHTLHVLGVDRVRLTASWSSLTRDPSSRRAPAFDAADPASYEQGKWQPLDRAVQAAAHEGLSVLMDIGFWAPRWAAGGPRPRARANIDPRAFAAFSVAVARRYSGTYTPATVPADPAVATAALGPLPAVDMLALWNEPNHPSFLLPQWTGPGRQRRPVSPGLYRAMVRAAYPAVKSVRRDLRVLVGNTSSSGGLGRHDPVAPLRFLRRLACVDDHLRPVSDGDCAHFRPVPGDGWAHHPYSLSGPPNRRPSAGHADDVYLANLDDLSRTLNRLVAMGRLAPRLRDIYLTECGYETAAAPGQRTTTEARQAVYMTWGELLASRVPAVKMFAQFLLRDQPRSATIRSDSVRRPFGGFYTGLERVDGTPKPGLWSFMLGLVAEHRRRGDMLLWVRLRLGPRRRQVAIQRQTPAGPWTTISTSRRPGAAGSPDLSVIGSASFTRFARFVARARYRMLVTDDSGRWAPGLPVETVTE
jgi:hypothetical protein